MLPSSMPSIYLQIRTSHEATGLAHHEHRCTAILMRLTELSKHVLAWPLFPSLRELLEQSFYHGCLNIAWRDGIDSDAILAPLCCEIASELKHTRFGGVVRWADEAL